MYVSFLYFLKRIVFVKRHVWFFRIYKGLKSQYLFIFAGGLVAVLLVVVILYIAGVNQWICIPFGLLSGSLLVWLTFRLNARYGEHGLMKLLSGKRHPRYLIHRRRLFRLLTKRRKK